MIQHRKSAVQKQQTKWKRYLDNLDDKTYIYQKKIDGREGEGVKS